MALNGSVALVTGASRGIGGAIAQKLAQEGATVVGTATTDAGAAAIEAYLNAAGNTGAGMRLDVNEPTGPEATISAIQQRYGEVTILVNNAGITRDNLLLRMKDDDWDAVIDTNLKSVYRLSKAVLRGMMKARHGRIINIGSVVGVSGNAGQTSYSAAKAALIGFTKSLAQEVVKKGVTVNAVSPGYVQTEMVMAIREDMRQQIVSQIPAGRLAMPEEVADAVAFLASENSAYITGTNLAVNGGLHMYS
jgi:3-oxoacyl-[acyl-carrier protein] reductase